VQRAGRPLLAALLFAGAALPLQHRPGSAHDAAAPEPTARPERIAAPMPQTAYLKASNAEADDELGYSVAISGDTMVVGALREDGSMTSTVDAPNNDADGAGAVYVYVRSGADWVPLQYLKSPTAQSNNWFGASVAIQGDTLVIGEQYGLNNYGAAYVFTRTAGTWNLATILTPTNPGFTDRFGCSVAIDGDTIVVGAYSEDGSAASTMASPDNLTNDAGAAYVFTRSGDVWTQQAYLKASNADATDYFGYSVDVSGDAIVVGAMYESGSFTSTAASPNNAAQFAGGAYVYTRTGGVWTQAAYLKPSDIASFNLFGSSVAVDGDTVLVGSPNGRSSNGATYVYVQDGGIWAPQATLEFAGDAVALDGDLAAIGNTSDSGTTKIFVRNGTTWTYRAYLDAPNSGDQDKFGYAVGLDGTTLAATALNEDGDFTSTLAAPNEFASNAGAAYVVPGPGSMEMSLSAGTLTPDFVTATQSYTAAVSNRTNNVVITTRVGWLSVLTTTAATPCNEYSVADTPTPKYVTTCSLVIGPNLITVTVNDGTGVEQSYVLTITRAPSSNAFLSNLESSTGALSPPCAVDDRRSARGEGCGFTFTATVSNAVASVVLTPTTSHVNATYVVANAVGVCASNACALAVGVNAITVTVTAEDGVTTQDYVVTITRAASSDASLSELALSTGALSPAFVSTTTSYAASVAHAVASAVLTPTTSHANATYVVANAAGVCASNACALAVGVNAITVTVTAEDGVTTQDYVVTITREAASITGDAYVTPSRGAVTTSTVSIIDKTDGDFLGATGVYVKGAKMFHVVRSRRRIDFTMKQSVAVAGTTVDVTVVKANGDVVTITQAYTFVGPTSAAGSTSTGAVLTTTSGITVTVPPQGTSLRPDAAQIGGSLVITYAPSGVLTPPGDVPLSFFDVAVSIDDSPIATLTNALTMELPVDPALVPAGQRPWLFELTSRSSSLVSLSSGRWSLVPNQTYDPATGLVTAPTNRLGTYVLVTASMRWNYFPTLMITDAARR
jgi:hypothetical protein